MQAKQISLRKPKRSAPFSNNRQPHSISNKKKPGFQNKTEEYRLDFQNLHLKVPKAKAKSKPNTFKHLKHYIEQNKAQEGRTRILQVHEHELDSKDLKLSLEMLRKSKELNFFQTNVFETITQSEFRESQNRLLQLRVVFNKLDFQRKGVLSKRNLGLHNLEGGEMKLIQNFIFSLMSDKDDAQFDFVKFERIVSEQN